MREIRQSGSEGGVVGNGHPYPYTSPGCNPGDRRPHVSRSEGTLHTTEWPMPALALCGVPSERSDFAPIYPQGSTLGWYAQPRWGRGLSFGLTLRIYRPPPTTHRPSPTADRPWFMVHGSSSRRSMNVLWLAFEVPRWGRGLSSGLHSEPPQRGRGWCCGLICCHSHGNLRVALRAAVWRDGPERRPRGRPREMVPRDSLEGLTPTLRPRCKPYFELGPRLPH